MLPEGSIRLASVEIDGQAYEDFDADKLTVKLPESDRALSVKVRIEPTSGLDHFSCASNKKNTVLSITLSGELDARAVPHLAKELGEAAGTTRVVLDMTELTAMCAQGARALLFARQKLDIDEPVFVVGAKGQPLEMLNGDEFTEEITLVETLKDLPA
jgi:anti-anti-sigma factor